MSTRTITVNTYANGFGIWHADVTMHGVGDDLVARSVAEAALESEINQRHQNDHLVHGVTLVQRASRDGGLTYYFREGSDTDLVPCAYCSKPTPPERQAAAPWQWPGRGLVTNCLDCAGED